MSIYKRVFGHIIPKVVLIALIAFFWCEKSIAAGNVGEPLPAFSLSNLNGGGQLTNRSLLGHVSLLNVWASWCGYCMSEHSMLMNIKATGVPIYGIDFRDNPNSAKSVLANRGNPYRLVGADWNGNVTEALGVSGTPVTFVVDKHGIIRYRYTGGIDSSGWKSELLPVIQKYQAQS